MNIFCSKCNKFLGLATFAALHSYVLEAYCEPCDRKFRQDLGLAPIPIIRAQEHLVNNDADLETQFVAFMNQTFN